MKKPKQSLEVVVRNVFLCRSNEKSLEGFKYGRNWDGLEARKTRFLIFFSLQFLFKRSVFQNCGE